MHNVQENLNILRDTVAEMYREQVQIQERGKVGKAQRGDFDRFIELEKEMETAQCSIRMLEHSLMSRRR